MFASPLHLYFDKDVTMIVISLLIYLPEYIWGVEY